MKNVYKYQNEKKHPYFTKERVQKQKTPKNICVTSPDARSCYKNDTLYSNFAMNLCFVPPCVMWYVWPGCGAVAGLVTATSSHHHLTEYHWEQDTIDTHWHVTRTAATVFSNDAMHSGRNQDFLSNGCIGIGCIYLVKILFHCAMLQCMSRYYKPPWVALTTTASLTITIKLGAIKYFLSIIQKYL